MRALLALAARYGVAVVVATLPDDMLGCYVPGERRIYLDSRLTPAERRSVLAHELGHVHEGHPCEGPVAVDVATGRERRADVYAARLLIDPAEYARWERIDPDPHAIAEELEVTAEVVEVYRAHCLARVEGVGYALPRLGSGQWAYRAEYENA